MAVVTQFTIIQGKALDFSIVVKEDGTLTPLELDPSDTFTYSLVEKKTNVKYATDVAMTIVGDGSNGEITGTISEEVSATLPLKRAAAEDNYIPRANLRLVINGDTVAQGQFTAAIENVYVIAG
jgi:hypothetical protein